MLTGIHSVVIWTEDMSRLLPFYRDVLGLKPQMENEGFVAFEASSGAALALGAHSEVKGRSQDPYRMMVDLQVDDCQAEYERLSKQGVEFLKAPGKEGDGAIIATLFDPDGNILQLFQMT